MSPRRGKKAPEPEAAAESEHDEIAHDGEGGGDGEGAIGDGDGEIGEIEEGDPTRRSPVGAGAEDAGEAGEDEEVDDELARGDDDDDLDGEGDADDEEGADEPGVVAPDAKREVKGFLEALIEKGVLILVEGARVDGLVPDVLKALATKDRRRAALFLDALIDHEDVDEVFLDEDQVVKLLAAWF